MTKPSKVICIRFKDWESQKKKKKKKGGTSVLSGLLKPTRSSYLSHIAFRIIIFSFGRIICFWRLVHVCH
jgi:hypothetical protein